MVKRGQNSRSRGPVADVVGGDSVGVGIEVTASSSLGNLRVLFLSLWGVGGEVLEQERWRISRDKETHPPMSQDARFHQGDRLPQFTSPDNLLLLSLQQPLGSLVIKRCCLCLFP